MGRARSYWLRRSDGCYYCTHQGKKTKLGEAGTPLPVIEARFKDLVALSEKSDQLTVRILCLKFLDYCKSHRSPATHRWYKDFLDPFIESVSPSLPVERLTPSQVSKWIDSKYGEASASTRHGAGRAVTRMVNWAIEERLIGVSPLKGFRKQTPTPREAVLTQAQYEKCVRLAKEPLKSVIRFMRHTGCRPWEMRIIEWRWFDGDKIILPVVKSKGKKKRRVIYMDATARKIAETAAADFLIGPIFCNSHDKPWTKDSLDSAFKRLRAKTGIEKLCPYSLRHTFATEQLKRGVDVATVAALMGNSARMVLETYQHVARDEAHLLGAVNGQGPLTPAPAPA